MAQRVQLRRLLPKPATDTHMDKSEISAHYVRVNDIMVLVTQLISSFSDIRTSVYRAQSALIGSETVPRTRSPGKYQTSAQQARRQRELAASIQQDMSSKRQWCDPDLRSKAQKFRRRIEAAERRLERAPDCGMCSC
ncbi:hypothetical protein B0H12DRAFT_1111530 [Mycena haematopus]|nr:hypothetical protein B0H12DRAFT_1111530 [Mycena haematopus]